MELSFDIKKLYKVSIIVCARNEEKNIRNLLEALLLQDYDLSCLEIIIANDQSLDRTESILKEYANNHPFIKYFNITNRANVKSPKKNALRKAIEMATGEILLLTDADCIPTKNWINSHICMYNVYPETEMVAGFSKTKVSNLKLSPWYQQFEHIDFLVLMFAAQGAIQSGIPFSCSGQNLSYKKNSYEEIGGFDDIDHFISGDDILLMQKFVKNKKVIKFAAYADSFTETQPIQSWRGLVNQRARWASNLKMMFKMNFKFFIYLISCFFCFGLMPFFNVILYIIKPIFDVVFIKKALKLWKIDTIIKREGQTDKYNCSSKSLIGAIKESFLLKWYLISPIYILTITGLGIFSIFKWKSN